MLLLMCRDTVVFSMDTSTSEYCIHNEMLLPWALKGTFREIDFNQNMSCIVKDAVHNYSVFVSYVARRVLSMSRKHAKEIRNLLRVSQMDDEQTKFKIALICRAVTLQDDYWLKDSENPVTWKDVNLRHNSWNDVMTRVALHGTSLTLQGKLTTPEITTHGTFAKAWVRKNDDLFLLKKGNSSNWEAKVEVEVSNVLGCCSVNRLQYELTEHEGELCCQCKCLADDSVSMLHAEDLFIYCNRNDLNFEQTVLDIDAEAYYKMWIVDYLISNGDRHLMNWGFLFDPETTKILGCLALYDHNNSFDVNVMNDPDTVYVVNGKSMRESAKYAMTKVDFYFTKEPARDLFITQRHYDSFMSRAKELGIKTKMSIF